MDGTIKMPLARTGELAIEELGDELLVYDLKIDRAHSLGATVSRVWRACDGSTTIDDLSPALNLDPATVVRAIEELDSCELLDPGVPGNGAGTTTRRELGLKLAKVGAAAAVVPMIVSVSAATARQAGSPPTEAECQALTVIGHGCGECHKIGCCCCEPPGTTSTSSTKPCHADCVTQPDCNIGTQPNCNGPTANCKLKGG